MRFPYLEFEGRHLPIIRIGIKGSEWVEFHAFVDSGAGYSVFRAAAAEMLGLDIEKGTKEFVKIGDGSFIEVFAFKLPVSLAGIEFEAKIGFSRSLGVGFNILGRQDIFQRFIVCFNESEKWAEFAPR